MQRLRRADGLSFMVLLAAKPEIKMNWTSLEIRV
jgi:hypothetical protein